MTTDVRTPPVNVPEPAPEPSVPRANRPIWQLIVGVAAIVGVLWAIGGWAVPFVIFAILLMIVMHELGHLATAKWTGMRATEFFVGFGPRLWSKRVGDTEYGIKAYPLGGYVKIPGMTNLEQIDPADEAGTYRAATFPRRVLVASAGSLMHLLMALVLAWFSLVFVGGVVATPTKVLALASWTQPVPTPAVAGGLHSGDVVVSVNGSKLTSPGQFSSMIGVSAGQSVALGVERNGHLITLHVVPVSGSKIEPTPGDTSHAYIGVEIHEDRVMAKQSMLAAVPGSVKLIGQVIDAEFQSLRQIFSPSGITNIANQVTNGKGSSNPVNQAQRPSSIVGVADIAIKIAHRSPAELLYIFMAINIAIGMINMLPMLPLDGGHVAIAIYERARSRKGRPPYHADVQKLMPVVYVFVAALAMLFIVSLYLDITHPINF